MLKRLQISNYALIESLDISFGPGLTIITGETGAGKSIMMGALSLLKGGRSDTRAIGSYGNKAVIEAIFSEIGKDAELMAILHSADLDADDDEVIIRREISASGRSRVFINDTPVTLSILEGVTSRLIDIHSQHSNMRLMQSDEQLKVVDAISNNEALREEYSTLFSKFVAIRNKIKKLRAEIEHNAENSRMIEYQLAELEELKPKAGELEEIERRYDLLSDADEMREKLGMLGSLLGGDSGSVLNNVAEARSVSDKVDFSLFGDTPAEGEKSFGERLQDVYIEVKDVYETIEGYYSEINTDPAALAKYSKRIEAYYDAFKRFHVTTSEELYKIYVDLGNKLAMIEGDSTEMPELEREGKRIGAALKECAARLSESRKAGAAKLSAELTEQARPLGLKNLNFTVSVTPSKLNSTGGDAVEFLCAFNKNSEPLPISKTASGGEVSRLMLTLKEIMASVMTMPTVIFDEIDTGVSGEIADKMGEMMRAMGERMQVMAITHLPQVAAKGQAHYKVYKSDVGNTTLSSIRKLDDQERVTEIAGMISGSEVGEAARDTARELLNN